MEFDPTSLIQSAVAAIVTGAGSLATAMHSAEKKYEEINTKLRVLTDDTVRVSSILTWKQSLENELRNKGEALINDRFDTLRRAFRLEMDNFKDSLERRSRDFERQPTKPDLVTLEELRRRVELLDQKVDKVKEEQTEYADDQGKQWNEMNRTLGQIMGEMRRSRTPYPK